MEDLVEELVKQLGEANKARWTLLALVEMLMAKPELINDKDFHEEISHFIESRCQ